jgi:two-component sensor histidine kinase
VKLRFHFPQLGVAFAFIRIDEEIVVSYKRRFFAFQSTMIADNNRELAYEAEIDGLRELLTQAGLDAARLLAQAGIKASENEAARQLQRLLLEELHHRVKNTLATVIAITSQSLRSADTLEQGRVAVESRLFALGRAHDLLLQANWARARLHDVIRAAVQPFDDQRLSRFSIEDISLEIDASAVLPLTMSLNELCTNAVKYGALSVPTGRIAITLSADEKADRFRLSWTEAGGPIVQEPKRRSFGTRLINRLADQLRGKVHLKYEPQGIACELDIPLSALCRVASEL